MKKLNKKGFTLIELLVTIALMLSILGIAIISFITVSDRKKEEAWKQVKNQIETAAYEYFIANEYLYEGLSNNVNGTISVGKLVQEDYLNKITNPKTGKALSMCAIVNVTKNGNKVKSTFNDDSENSENKTCDSDNSITVSEPGAPDFEIKVGKLNGKHDPYNNGQWFHDGAKFSLTSMTGGNGEIDKILSCNTTVKNNNCNPDTEVKNEVSVDLTGKGNNPTITVCYKVTNTSGKSAQKCASAKVDNTAPTCKLSSDHSGWTNQSVTVKGTCKDDGSGCKTELTKTVYENQTSADGKNVSPGNVEDNVGHSTKCNNVTVKIDKTPPVISNLGLKSQNNSYNSNLVYGSFTVKDSLSGINYVTSNIPRSDNGVTKWSKNGQKEWVITGYTGKAKNGLDGSKISLNITAYDIAGNKSKGSSSNYTIYKECSKTTKTTVYSKWGSCSKTSNGTQSRNIRTDSIDKYTEKTCMKGTTTTESRSCNTLKITKISGASTTYCSLRNPWGYSNKSWNQNITGNNCKDTSNNPRVIFGKPTATISGKKATIKVTLDIYSTSWEMLATSSNSSNAREICVTDGNNFSTSYCRSKGVEIKSKSSTWNAYSHVLSKTVTMTIDDVSKYTDLAFKIYSPGHGKQANPTCTKSGTYSCVTSTGTPFIFQSDYIFKVSK